jgi:hypothetical protein
LAYNTAGLTVYYNRNTGSASVAVSLATMTLGTWASGGFKEVDSTNMPGLYQFGVPNAALVSGADGVTFFFLGTGVVPNPISIELTATNNQDGVHGGMTALPNATAASSGGLPTSGTGANQIQLDSSGRVTYAPGEMQIKKNVAYNNFPFLMVSSADNITPKTGLGSSIVAQVKIDGAAFTACTNTPSEAAYGIYIINLAAADLNGSAITLMFAAVGAATRYVTIATQA